MLTKTNINNHHLGTGEIIKFSNIYIVDKIQDNLFNSLLVKIKNKIFIYNYKLNKIYNYNKIQIIFNHKIFIKQLNSFEQNNLFFANSIRKFVLSHCKNSYNTILGIGGEYYIYFPFIDSKKYIGMTNNNTIIEDAQNNIPYSINYKVDYNNHHTYPNIENCDIIIINMYNINNELIKYIKNVKFNKLIIISCQLNNNKLKLLVKYFLVKKIKYFIKYNQMVRVLEIYNLV